MQASFDSNTLKMTVKASTWMCVREINQHLEINASRCMATCEYSSRCMLFLFILDFA